MPQPKHRDVEVPACTQPIPPLRIVQSQLNQVQSLMIDEFINESLSDLLRPSMEHALGHPGKMIRPGLVLLSGLGFGRLTPQHLHVAAIMEMIHQATLLHDDVLDEAEIRRGRPAARCLWGNATAVLLGDMILSRVLQRCIDLRPDVAHVVADMACRVCQGELRQTLKRENGQITEQEYLGIIQDKTASFFTACCEVGAILAEASSEQIEAVSLYGMNVGMAFQMTDDVLDLVASPEEAGKTAGLDAGKGILTMPVIHLLRILSEADRDDLINHFQGREDLSDLLREQTIRHGSLDYVRSRCQDHVNKAIQALNGIDDSCAKKALVELAHYSLIRKV